MIPSINTREGFDLWFARNGEGFVNGPFGIRQSESALRMEIMKGEARRDACDAETASLRRAAMRLQDLARLRHEAGCRAGRARGDLILLLRLQGRHDEADRLLPPRRQGNDHSRAAERAREAG